MRTWVLCGLIGLGAVMAGRAEETVTPTAADQALVRRAQAAARAAGATPGRETHNLTTRDWPAAAIAMLAGEKPATAEQLAAARQAVNEKLALAASGKIWPVRKPIAVPHTTGPIQIDGQVKERTWRRAWTSTALYAFENAEPLDQPATRWRLMWDEQYLYVAYECDDSEIVSEKRSSEHDVYREDCVEVFLRSDADLRHWEVVVNASGSLFDGLHTKKLNDWGIEDGSSATLTNLQYAAWIQRDPASGAARGYSVEIAFPLARLPGVLPTHRARAGDRLYGMLVRLDSRDGKLRPYAFVPLKDWGHNIWNHVPLVLSPRRE